MFSSLALLNALIMFSEFPDVEIPIKMSPGFPNASVCLSKISLKFLSFPQAVITEVSVVSAIAGKPFLSIINLFTSSPEICWASAAEPPFPQIKSLFPFLNAWTIALTASWISCIFWMLFRNSCFVLILSLIVFWINSMFSILYCFYFSI